MNLGKIVHEYCEMKEQPYIRGCYLNDISVVGPLYNPHSSKEYLISKYLLNTHDDEQIN